MSFQILKYNLQKLIERSNRPISEIERSARVKRNRIYNILHGFSKKPSADALIGIAGACNITVQDLYDETHFTKKDEALPKEDCILIQDIVNLLTKEILHQNLKMPLKILMDLIYECFQYNKSVNLLKPDERFIRWILKQKVRCE